jgi:hypothetical protein
MARWWIVALTPGAVKRSVGDLGHLRLVTLITGSWCGGGRRWWPGSPPGSARPGRPGRRGGRPPQAGAQLLGHDLDLPGAPVPAVQVRCWSRPITMARLPLARDRAACSACSRHTTTVKNDGSSSRQPTPPPGTWPGRSLPPCAAARVVGEVAGEAQGCLGHGVPLPVAWPGGLPCPWTPGDGGHHGIPTGHQEQAAEPAWYAAPDADAPVSNGEHLATSGSY